MKTLRWYEVLSAEYGTVIPVLDYGQGPTEYGRDYMLTQAYNAHEAVRRTVQHWLNAERPTNLDNGGYCRGSRCSGQNPFAGHTATRASEELLANCSWDPAFTLPHPDGETAALPHPDAGEGQP